MPIRFGWLGLGFAAALVVATPAQAQDDPVAPADRTAQEVRTQRQERARIHQPGQRTDARQRAEVGQRAENQQGRDGATRGTRTRSRVNREGATGNRGTPGARGNRGSRGSQLRDNAMGSRARDATRRRNRVHRPAN